MAKNGKIARGIVRRVMSYGAIVQLDDGLTGLIHISEMDNKYVRDVREYCHEGFPVVVQILRQKGEDRWELSMKRARNNPLAAELRAQVAAEIAADPPPAVTPQADYSETENFGAGQPMYDGVAPHQPLPRALVSPKKRAEFDEKLRDFLTDSSDHIEDVKRHHENRLGGRRR